MGGTRRPSVCWPQGWLFREFRPTAPGLPRCPEKLVDAIRKGEVDALAFASPSSAVSFAVALGGLASIPPCVAVAAIGPTTAAACTRAGRAPDVVAAESSAEALGETVVGYLADRSSELPML